LRRGRLGAGSASLTVVLDSWCKPRLRIVVEEGESEPSRRLFYRFRRPARPRGGLRAPRGGATMSVLFAGETNVKKNNRCLGLALVTAIAGVAHAQPPGVTFEEIARELPREGAPLAIPGPYEVVSDPAFGLPTHVVYRPADL